MAEPVADLLRAHRARQAEGRLASATSWPASDFVFTTSTGHPVDGGNLLRGLKQAAASVGLAGANVHTLRHSAATALLEENVNLKVVSEQLGHANIGITADLYQHVTLRTRQEAAEALSRVFTL